MGLATATVKYVLYIFNFLFVICGLGLLSAGIVTTIDVFQYAETVHTSTMYAGPVLLIVVGAIVLIISFLGCCGAIKENRCMLHTYAGILLFIFIVQIAVAIYVLVVIKDGGEIEDTIRSDIEENFRKYTTSQKVKEEVDEFQLNLKCCGIDDYKDYMRNDMPIPTSCCIDRKGCNVSDKSKIYSEGCYSKIVSNVKQSLRVVGWVAMGLCVIEIAGSLFSICLASSIRSGRRF